jgi:hypothetical protein
MYNVWLFNVWLKFNLQAKNKKIFNFKYIENINVNKYFISWLKGGGLNKIIL